MKTWWARVVALDTTGARFSFTSESFCTFVCISLGCGLVSGKCDCLSLHTGSQRLVTVGVGVIFVKYYKCWCFAKYIQRARGVHDSLDVLVMFGVKGFPNTLLSCTQSFTGNTISTTSTENESNWESDIRITLWGWIFIILAAIFITLTLLVISLGMVVWEMVLDVSIFLYLGLELMSVFIID